MNGFMHRFIVSASRASQEHDEALKTWLGDPCKSACHFTPKAHISWHSPSCRMQFAVWSSCNETGVSVDSFGRASGLMGWAARTDNLNNSKVVGYESMTSSEKDPLTAEQTIDGIYCAFRLKTDDEALFFRDPLGLYPLYHWSNCNVSLLSNSAWLIWCLAKEVLGLVIPCDEEGISAVLLNGQMFGDVTGFQGIRAVPSYHSVHFDARGEMQLKRTQSAFWSLNSASASRTQDEATAIQRMSGICLAAVNATDNPLCELTAGRDSRMVLELLHLASVANDVEFITFGTTNSDDASQAARLASRIRARHCSYQWPTIAGGPFLEGFIAHLERTSGQLGCWEMSNSIADEQMFLSGLAGEGLRSNYSAFAGLQSITDVSHAFDRYEFGRYEYLRPGVKDHLKKRLKPLVLAPFEAGARAEDLFDIFYLEHRLRRWVSVRLDRFDRYVFPLYSPNAIRHVMFLSSDQRATAPLHRAVSSRAGLSLEGIDIRRGTSWRSTFSGQKKRPNRRLASSQGDAMGRSSRSNIRRLCAERVTESRRDVIVAAIEHDHNNKAFELLDREKIIDAAIKYDCLDRRQRIELHQALTVLLWLGLARPDRED